jgi:type I restriction enzyme, S subunit
LLTDIARLESGHTPSRRHAEWWTGDIPWMSIQDARDHHGGRINDTTEHTNQLGIDNSSARLLPMNTVGLSRTASVGYVVVMGRPMATSQDFVNWICSDQLEPEFLKYLLIAEGDDLLRFASGSVHQTIYFPEVKAFHVCIPQVKDQRRIVAILDEAFEVIAAARANAEKNLENARAVFDSHVLRVFSSGSKAWPERKLGVIADVQSGGTPLRSRQEFWGGDIPWYSSGELNSMLTRNPERHITKLGLSGSNAKLFPKGSLLIGMYDTAALKMSILDRAGAFNQAVAGVRPNERVDMAFVLHAITAVKPRLLLQRRGVRQKNLSLGKIKDISIPLPALPEQRATVARLSRLSTETSSLVAIYQRKLAALDELTKSLLHQAFTGHL